MVLVLVVVSVVVVVVVVSAVVVEALVNAAVGQLYHVGLETIEPGPEKPVIVSTGSRADCQTGTQTMHLSRQADATVCLGQRSVHLASPSRQVSVGHYS